MAYGSLNVSYGQTHTSCVIRGVGGVFWRLSLVVWCVGSADVCPAGNIFLVRPSSSGSVSPSGVLCAPQGTFSWASAHNLCI